MRVTEQGRGRWRNIVAAAMAGAAAWSASAADLVVQAGGGTAAGSGIGNASTFNSTVEPTRVADNFTLGTAETITDVTWWGQSLSASTTAGQGATANVLSFTIEFFANNAGSVGASIASEPVAAGLVLAVADGVSANDGSDMFRYTVSLTSDVGLGAGNYFVSVTATLVLPADDVIWIWEASANGPDDGVQLDQGTGFAPFVVGEGQDDAAFILSGNIVADPDTDGDGLTDSLEGSIGTFPNDSDSDDDGLSDGVEYDDGNSCLDPLSADTDGDGLEDGFEVDCLDSDPCNADTDGDGVTDDLDPSPTIPGVTYDFLADWAREVAHAICSSDLSNFTGPNNVVKRVRRAILCGWTHLAANLIDCGDTGLAWVFLSHVHSFLDGEPCPNDWMSSSSTQEGIACEIECILVLLED